MHYGIEHGAKYVVFPRVFASSMRKYAGFEREATETMAAERAGTIVGDECRPAPVADSESEVINKRKERPVEIQERELCFSLLSPVEKLCGFEQEETEVAEKFQRPELLSSAFVSFCKRFFGGFCS